MGIPWSNQPAPEVDSIGIINIKYDQEDYRIRIDYQNRTINQIMDQLFSDYQLNRQLKKFYSIAAHTSQNDKNTLIHMGGTMTYRDLTEAEKRSLKLIIAPLRRDMNQPRNQEERILL